MTNNIQSSCTGWTFQFLTTCKDADHRVVTPFWSDKEMFDDALKEAQTGAKEIGAKIGFFLKGHHSKIMNELPVIVKRKPRSDSETKTI